MEMLLQVWNFEAKVVNTQLIAKIKCRRKASGVVENTLVQARRIKSSAVAASIRHGFQRRATAGGRISAPYRSSSCATRRTAWEGGFSPRAVTSLESETGGMFSILFAFSYVRGIPLDQRCLLSGAEYMSADSFGRLHLFE